MFSTISTDLNQIDLNQQTLHLNELQNIILHGRIEWKENQYDDGTNEERMSYKQMFETSNSNNISLPILIILHDLFVFTASTDWTRAVEVAKTAAQGGECPPRR